MKKLPTFLVFIIFISTTLYSQWNEIDYNPTKEALFDIASPDGLNLYLVGDHGLILHSNNSGVSWDPISIASDTLIISIEFVNSLVGYKWRYFFN